MVAQSSYKPVANASMQSRSNMKPDKLIEAKSMASKGLSRQFHFLLLHPIAETCKHVAAVSSGGEKFPRCSR